MQDMTNMAKSKRREVVLKRDNYLCGIHLGGCGERLSKSDQITLDHIIPESWWKDREPVRPDYYNQEWNFQPMHDYCNSGDKKGQIYGFPVFSCRCHWLRIEQTDKGFVLVLFYRKGDEAFGHQICTEGDLVVISKQNLQDSLNLDPGETLVDMTTITWSLANHKPGIEGVTGPGYGGHGLPMLLPDQVHEFNQLEIRRVADTTEETIAKFNPRPDEPRITAIYTT